MARWSKVEISGVNTSTLPVLSRDEAKALFIEAKAGSESARQTLIQGNLRLVLSVIKKFDGRNENPDDLFQVGCIGLIKGIDNFNPDMDVYPSTYLVPMILGEVRRYLRDSGSVRVSRSMRDTAYKVLQAKEKFIAEHQREPSVEEIAKILDIKREDVVFALDAIVDPVSLYEPIYSDVLMMDEPSLGLAPLVVQGIFDIIRTINQQGVTVLLIEQNANMALKIADYAYVLETGCITKSGTGAALLADESIKEAYLGKRK